MKEYKNTYPTTMMASSTSGFGVKVTPNNKKHISSKVVLVPTHGV